MGKIVFITVVGLVLIGVAGWTIGDDRTLNSASSMDQPNTTTVPSSSNHQVTAQRLAQWMSENRGGILLLDLRPKEQYELSHISSATQISIPDLLRLATLRTLPTDKAIIVYAGNGYDTQKVVLTLRLAGFDSYALKGGISGWQYSTHLPDNKGEIYAQLLTGSGRAPTNTSQGL